MHRFLTLSVFIFLVTGCSSKLLLPYEEDQLCQRGAGEGLCGSVSQVYKHTAKVNYEE